DWLGDGLCKISDRWDPRAVHRDRTGHIRVIATEASYERFVERAFDKIRQAGWGMPAVMIRQLEALETVARYTTDDAQRAALQEQADMILAACDASVAAAPDRADVRRRYDAFAGAVSAG